MVDAKKAVKKQVKKPRVVKTDKDIKRALGTIKRAKKTRLQKIRALRTQTQQKVQQKSRKLDFVKDKKHRVGKLRSSLQPGTVLILLAGPHKGKRVVLLKSLDSGLLMVTGPFKWNGVPIRRVLPAYVIATKLRFDISKVNIPAALNDEFFRRQILTEKKKDAAEQMFATEKKTYAVSEDRKKHQKSVDSQLLTVIKKHPDVKIIRRYIRTLFCLEKRDYPHKMVF